MRPVNRLWPLLGLALCLLACLLVIRGTTLRTDLSAFLPSAPSTRQQLLIDQLEHGQLTRLLLIGLTGGNARQRAQLSEALKQRLRANPVFVSVQNGSAQDNAHDQLFLFQHRYLLDPRPPNEGLSVPRLHQDIQHTLHALSGAEGELLRPLFAHDPSGVSLALLDQLTPSSGPRIHEGVWSSADGQRMLLMALIRAPGTDTDGQAHALTIVQQTFDTLTPSSSPLHLELSGAPALAVASRQTIESQVSRLASASLLLVILLLGWVYRSLPLLLVGLLPVLTGAVVGMASVALVFGQIHGLTLGFGTTLIGEAVDYAIYFYLQRSSHLERHRFWRTLMLGTATSMVGFATLLASGFPGLSQLGVYSLSGLAGAAAVTRFILPRLVPQTLEFTHLQSLERRLDSLFQHAQRLRGVPWVLAGGALVILFGTKGLWNQDPAALSALSPKAQQLDQQLRQDLGAADNRWLIILPAATAEQALLLAEQASHTLSDCQEQNRIAGFESPSRVLPSQTTQRLRQQALPPPDQARANLQQALRGLPLSPDTLAGFLADIEQQRQQPLLQRADLDGTSWGLWVDSLLVQQDGAWQAMIPLHPGNSPTPQSSELGLDTPGMPSPIILDLVQETHTLFDHYRQRILQISGWGLLAIIILLRGVLGSWSRTARVMAPLLAAVLVDVGLLRWAGVALTLLHLVGLLLVVAIGSNYALFFESTAINTTQPRGTRINLSLLVANLTTVGSFGILALSPVLVLSALGTTVSLGAFLCFLFAAVSARRP